MCSPNMHLAGLERDDLFMTVAHVGVSVSLVRNDSRLVSCTYPRPFSTSLIALSTPRSAASMSGRSGRRVPMPAAWPVQ